MQRVLELGIRFITWLQSLGDWQVLPMKAFTFLGSEEFFMLVLPVFYWCYSTALGMRVAVILMLSGGINDAFKILCHQPRPYWVSSAIEAHASETSFGLPSGHSQTAVAIWGTMAAWFRKGWAWIAAVLVIFLIGLSRMSLGVHFPQDVLSGWLIGVLLLVLVIRFWQPVAVWGTGLKLGRQVLMAFLGSLLLLLLPLIAFTVSRLQGWQAPQTWASFAGEALSLQGSFTNAGTLFGLLAGAAWLAAYGGFVERGSWWQYLLRYFLGAAGVLAIRYGLGAIFPPGDEGFALVLRYVRYALIGVWVTGAAPLVFVALRLAKKKA